VKIWWDPD